MPRPKFYKRGTEIPTIDCDLVIIEKSDGTLIGVDTADQIGVETSLEEREAIRLVIKDIVRSQKRGKKVIAGHILTIRDNVFTPELVEAFQGGEITKDEEGKIIGYLPPAVGERQEVEVFKTRCYSAIYDAAGNLTSFEEIIYPNCTGNPVPLTSEDNVFRVLEYEIVSAPNVGERPYEINYIKPEELPSPEDTTPEG